jgi:hypothetical protein
MREETTIFRSSYIQNGGKFLASKYGYRAFPITKKGKHLAEPANRLKETRCEVLPSLQKLQGGICTGDKIRHPVLGDGIVLSITQKDTIIQFDLMGLRRYPTLKAHDQLTKL